MLKNLAKFKEKTCVELFRWVPTTKEVPNIEQVPNTKKELVWNNLLKKGAEQLTRIVQETRVDCMIRNPVPN